MSKLTKNIREQMARKLVAYRFKDKARAMTTTNRLLFERIYAYMYDDKTRAAMDAVLAIDSKAFPTTRDFNVNVGMWVEITSQLIVHTRVAGILAQGEIVPEVPVLYRHTRYGESRIDIPQGDKRDPKLHDDVKNFAIDREKFHEDCAKAYCEALSALETFTTGKKLAEGWPEAMEVIGDLIPEDNRTLPTVQVKDLNTKFGLPPETRAAAKKGAK